MPTEPSSLTRTASLPFAASGRACRSASSRLSKVVLPLPRNPVRRTTGTSTMRARDGVLSIEEAADEPERGAEQVDARLVGRVGRPGGPRARRLGVGRGPPRLLAQILDL